MTLYYAFRDALWTIPKSLLLLVAEIILLIVEPLYLLFSRGLGETKEFKSIFITGASSGIGRSLAELYANPGVTLFLVARRSEALEELRTYLSEKGAIVHTLVCDVTEKEKMEKLIEKADDMSPLDLVIANAGCSTYTAGGNHADHLGRRGPYKCIDINLYGMLNTLIPSANCMVDRKRGQLVAVASNSGNLLGWPGDPAYSAAKSAVISWCRAMRPRLKTKGVGISVVCPGIVDTAMTSTRREYKSPGMTPKHAASEIKRVAEKNVDYFTYSFLYFWQAPLISRLPRDWLGKF